MGERVGIILTKRASLAELCATSWVFCAGTIGRAPFSSNPYFWCFSPLHGGENGLRGAPSHGKLCSYSSQVFTLATNSGWIPTEHRDIAQLFSPSKQMILLSIFSKYLTLVYSIIHSFATVLSHHLLTPLIFFHFSPKPLETLLQRTRVACLILQSAHCRTTNTWGTRS